MEKEKYFIFQKSLFVQKSEIKINILYNISVYHQLT
jgi:hypothetical protein